MLARDCKRTLPSHRICQTYYHQLSSARLLWSNFWIGRFQLPPGTIISFLIQSASLALVISSTFASSLSSSQSRLLLQHWIISPLRRLQTSRSFHLPTTDMASFLSFPINISLEGKKASAILFNASSFITPQKKGLQTPQLCLVQNLPKIWIIQHNSQILNPSFVHHIHR